MLLGPYCVHLQTLLHMRGFFIPTMRLNKHFPPFMACSTWNRFTETPCSSETAEGRQSTVSLRDLTPAENTSEEATVMENREYPVFRNSLVKLGNQIPHTSSSDTLPNESSTSDSEEIPIPQKWPHPTSETDTYFSDTQQLKHKKKWCRFKARPSTQK